jgi:GGDEF domain-containing protein
MTGQPTAKPMRVTERQKARARLILLTLIGLVCPPLAGVRSAPVWIFYVAFLVLYSLWCTRLVCNFAGDRRLGYLLSLTDAAILLPLMVWTSAASMQAVLVVVCASGLGFSYCVDMTRSRDSEGRRTLGDAHSLRTGETTDGPGGEERGTLLERALRVRLHVFETTQTRFALVLLRVVRFEEVSAYYGADEGRHLLAAVTRRGLRLLGPDAQHFILPGGRVAFLFATGADAVQNGASVGNAFERIDPYDVESLAMTLARKACEHLVDGHKVECVVGWASAPSDGMNADDLMYAAESGAQSSAAFRRVAGSRVPVPEKTRAVAG